MYKTLKMRAAETGQTISGLMNETLQAQLAADLDDIQAIQSRLANKETPLSYEAALKELQTSGVILYPDTP